MLFSSYSLYRGETEGGETGGWETGEGEGEGEREAKNFIQLICKLSVISLEFSILRCTTIIR